MEETNVKLVNELLAKIQPLIEQLNLALKNDNFNYQRILWDIENLGQQRDKVKADINALEQQIEVKKQQADSIVTMAKEEAEKIIAIARDKNLQAEKNKEESKKILEEAYEKKNQREKVKA